MMAVKLFHLSMLNADFHKWLAVCVKAQRLIETNCSFLGSKIETGDLRESLIIQDVL